MRISDWSSDVCSSDLPACAAGENCRGRLRSPPSARGDDRRDWPADTEGRVVTVQAIYKPASREVLLVLSGEYRVLPEAEAASAARGSEERRVGKECVSTCGAGWSTYT